MSNQFDKCPNCGETVLSVETTCSHCGEKIDDAIQSGAPMHEFSLGADEMNGFKKGFNFAKDFVSKHQVALGVGEIALGVAVITYGLQMGHINPSDIFASHDSSWGSKGALAGAGVGAIGWGALIGKIAGTITLGGIPGVAGVVTLAAPLLAGGAVLVMSAFGYTIADVASQFFQHSSSMSEILTEGSLLMVGLALILDGARRIAKDLNIKQLASTFKNGVIYLIKKTVDGVKRTAKQAREQVEKLGFKGVATGAASIGIGMTAGAGIAASTATVMGSHGLAAILIAGGFMSAPLWPVFAGGTAAFAVWKLARS